MNNTRSQDNDLILTLYVYAHLYVRAECDYVCDGTHAWIAAGESARGWRAEQEVKGGGR